MLSVKNVTKEFSTKKKSVLAVNNISFEINTGEIFGLIGTNGAGKTTTMRMIATIIKPTHGGIYIDGENIQKDESLARRKIGILFGGDTGLYDRLTARENIAYFGMLNGMSEKEVTDRIAELSKFFKMDDFLDRKAGTFSRGMKQKTAFARSIVHDPDIMLFDEPSAGLDILVAEEVLGFIKHCKKIGKTILLSSHDMAEVTELCDRVSIIDKGSIKDTGTVQELQEKYKANNMKEVFFDVVRNEEGGIFSEDF